MSFQSKGFTLIEMLITIAVIGILATIALPSYMHYIERGHLAQAHNELVNINNRIKTERVKQPSSYRDESQLRPFVQGLHKEDEVKKKYDIQVYVPESNSLVYHLVAKPQASSGYTKAVWMNSAGDAYKCDNAAAAERYATNGDCEKIGGK